jgi:hypothetical protein
MYLGKIKFRDRALAWLQVTEIHDDGRQVVVQEHVVGLQVPVRDRRRLQVVQVVDGVADLHRGSMLHMYRATLITFRQKGLFSLHFELPKCCPPFWQKDFIIFFLFLLLPLRLTEGHHNK